MTSPAPTGKTVTLPAVGKVKKQYVIAGVAITAGLVLWTYYNRSSGSSGAELVEDEAAFTSFGDPTMPTVTTTTVPDNTDVIDTNAEWTQRATEYLTGQGGWDGAFVSTTLGKFLARRALTPAEEAVPLAALAAFGQPPVGGPYNILSAPVAPAAPVTHKYARQLHRTVRPEGGRALVMRFSDREVATTERIEQALQRTVNDGANAKYRKYFTQHGGTFPAGAIQVTVVKKK